MNSKFYICFKISNLNQAINLLYICQNKKIIPIFFIDFYLIKGFGSYWVKELRNLLLKKFKKNDFKLYINCNKNHGLFIELVRLKIDYLKVIGNLDKISKLKQIAKINKITVNPNINIVNIDKIKKIELKIDKILRKEIK